MFNPMNYNTEREDNIIKNIAKEVLLECIQNGLETTLELAHYVVKLKLLNPKNGFTASEVMPRSLTQQLVMSVVEDMKQDTPAMNCIRLQVYWNNVNLNVADLKKEYLTLLAEKAETYQTELMNLDREDANKIAKLAANYILVSHNLGIINNPVATKETVAAIHSVFRNRDYNAYFTYKDEQKVEVIKNLAKKVTGIRLYLKLIGKGNDSIEDVRILLSRLESCKEDLMIYMELVSNRVQGIRNVISKVVPLDFFFDDANVPAEANLPPEFEANDLKHLKQILVIMLQHDVYLSDLSSKLEEIDGNVNFFITEFEDTLQKINMTVRDREAVPTVEVYDDFIRVGELWLAIQSYYYCFDIVQATIKNLEEINKREYFFQTPLEKFVVATQKAGEDNQRKSMESTKSLLPSSVLLLKETEDFQLEFRGFCAWTLFYGEGFLIPGIPQAGIFQHNGQWYAFSNKTAHENWSKDPESHLSFIYELLRHNTEMIDLLNAYDNLYSVRLLQLTKTDDRKVATRADEAQTVLHPVEKFWDKDYTFSVWELKKQALTLSRLVKCVTKSVQTVNHSHYRSSIGILAAPDKDKEVQTKRDNSCVHSTVANFLYGLRGHREDKFKVIQLTRPVEETCEREIILEKGDPCRDRQKQIPPMQFPYTELICPPWVMPEDQCKCSSNDSSYEYNGED